MVALCLEMWWLIGWRCEDYMMRYGGFLIEDVEAHRLEM